MKMARLKEAEISDDNDIRDRTVPNFATPQREKNSDFAVFLSPPLRSAVWRLCAV